MLSQSGVGVVGIGCDLIEQDRRVDGGFVMITR
jgi:hypothetical protein